MCVSWEHPLVFSHHDLIVSTCTIPPQQYQYPDVSKNVTAPRVSNSRFKTKWSDEGVAEYIQLLTPLLPQIRETWGSSVSNANISLLFSTTYSAMNLVTKATNKVNLLNAKHKAKPNIAPSISAAAKSSMNELQNLRRLRASSTTTSEELDFARESLSNSRQQFKKETRTDLALNRDTVDSNLHNILTNPSAAFHAFKTTGRSSAPTVRRMQVGSDKVYLSKTVADGMYDSLNILKAPNMDHYNPPPLH